MTFPDIPNRHFDRSPEFGPDPVLAGARNISQMLLRSRLWAGKTTPLRLAFDVARRGRFEMRRAGMQRLRGRDV